MQAGVCAVGRCESRTNPARDAMGVGPFCRFEASAGLVENNPRLCYIIFKGMVVDAQSCSREHRKVLAKMSRYIQADKKVLNKSSG